MGKSDSIRERRRTERVRWALMVQLAWKKGEVTAYTTDISVNGFFAETKEEIPVKTELTITFQVDGIEGSLPVEATGKVIRCVGPATAAATGVLPGVGVRFKRVKKNNKAFRLAVDSKLGRAELPRQERRSEPRLPVGMPVRWGEKDPPDRDGRMADVSGRGAMCVVKGDPPANGSRIYLSFKLPHRGEIKDVKAVARIKRSESHEGTSTVGIQFEFSSVGDDLLPLLKERMPEVAKESKGGVMSMGVGEAARALKDNIPHIKIGDKYHVFRWKWVLGWFSVALLFYLMLYFVIGQGTFN